jgi:hypothetical protein
METGMEGGIALIGGDGGNTLKDVAALRRDYRRAEDDGGEMVVDQFERNHLQGLKPRFIDRHLRHPSTSLRAG